MPITTDHAGRSYPPSRPYQVTAAKVTEFAQALGSNLDPVQPDQVPPTFAIIVANQAWQAMFDDPELGLELQRIVHGEQKFSYLRPLRIGDEITGTVTIDRVVQRGGTDMIYASVALTDADHNHVGTASSTLIHTPEADR